MAKKQCAVCGKPLGMFAGKFRVGYHLVCPECFRKAGFTSEEMAKFRRSRGDIFEETLRRIETNEKNRSETAELLERYHPSGCFLFDDEGERMMLAGHNQPEYKPEDYRVFAYDQLISYELVEDGVGIASGGLGRAAVGEIPADSAGAAGRGSENRFGSVCGSLEVKLALNNYKGGEFLIRLIDKPEEKNGAAYQEALKTAGGIVSGLRAIVDKRNNEALQAAAPVADAADEIRKFKALLDDGIITEEEFQAKKKQLLGI